ETVASLREFRFFREHGASCEGVLPVLTELMAGRPGRLLIHDDPADGRRVKLDESGDIDPSVDIADLVDSGEPHDGRGSGRMVDVAIRLAILRDVDIRFIPSTQGTGPDDNIGFVRTEDRDR